MAQAPAILDERGRCCGRKPLTYKRTRHYFCPRCCSAFALDTGQQIENWAWKRQADGRFAPTYPAQDYVLATTEER